MRSDKVEPLRFQMRAPRLTETRNAFTVIELGLDRDLARQQTPTSVAGALKDPNFITQEE